MPLRLWLLATLLLSLLLVPRAYAAEQRLDTGYFSIFYPSGEEKTANWYASFADDVDVSVSDLLGAEPVTGLTLHIYATEAEYGQANPMAEQHPGILAHAIPERKEIGVAVERLRQQPPELARESFRHEMTHVVAGALSSQNLPIGFQEGLAQYNELSESRSQEVVQAIQAAQAANAPLLSWRDLNDPGKFSERLEMAYPQSYTVMAFLADRYGMKLFSRFVDELRRGEDYEGALQTAYDQPMEKLEEEWKGYLPGFLKDGWKLNILSAHDLGPGIALYDSGRFAEARDVFARSEKLYSDLGKADKAAQAADYLTKATKAQGATTLADQARKALEGHDYAGAQSGAHSASSDFAALNLTSQHDRAEWIAQQSKRGLDAMAVLQKAQGHLAAFYLPQAQAEARQAGEAFAALGDGARVAEANKVLSDLWAWQRLVGGGALGAGALSVLLGGAAVMRSRRRARRVMKSAYSGEERASWL